MSLILSIKPEYAKRRRFPKDIGGGYIYFYETIPEQSITGLARVEKIVGGHPHDIIFQVLQPAKISRADYAKYFSGSKTAYGIYLFDVLKFCKPAHLRQLRKIWTEFNPPQNYRYMSSYDSLKLHEEM
ncbi:MAG: hypothetical protein H7843_09050 [Nitrospirota bacterium]